MKSSVKMNKTLVSKIDQLFASWNMPNSPGAALAIVQDNEVVYKKGYGYASLEYDIPITPSTIFHVASVSKQFTDFAILLLADDGKLSLDDDVRQYIPELYDFGQRITIKHLIHHTSGLRDQWQLLMLAGWRLDDVITHHRIMKLVMRQRELNFEPGAEFLYSNTGYTLLADIVERVSGKTFAEFCNDRIFRPLGMERTHFHDDHQQIVKNRAYSYAPKDTGFKKSVLSYATVGATSLFTTVEDLAKWINNFSKMEVGGSDVVKGMEEQFILNNGEKIEYACGLKIAPYKGLKTVSHSGSDAGFRSHLVMLPEHQLGIVVLANLGGINPESLTRQIVDIILSDVITDEQAVQSAPDSDQKITDEQLLGHYLIGPGMVMIISEESDSMHLDSPFAGKQKLVRSNGNEFLVGSNNKTVTCGYRDSQVYFDLSAIFGRKIEAVKIEIPELTESQLQEYEGVYYSEELDTHYEIVLQENELVIEHMAMPDCCLCPSDKDVLESVTSALGRFKFTRSDSGDITGFLLDRGRVRNVRFHLLK